MKQKKVFFWNSLAISMIQWILTIWSLVPLPFLNTVCTSGSSWFTYCWSLAWRIFEHYLASMWNKHNYVVVWVFFGTDLLWIEMKTDLFQSCHHCWVFQICWHIDCSTFTESSFRILIISTGIPSLPLALFVVMLPKAHLISYSRISGSRWVISPAWLSRSLRPLLYSFSLFLHLFLISSSSVRSTPFLSFTVPMFAWNVPFSSLHY